MSFHRHPPEDQPTTSPENLDPAPEREPERFPENRPPTPQRPAADGGGGVCCWVGLCCDPPRAARALLERLAAEDPRIDFAARTEDSPLISKPGSVIDFFERLFREVVIVPRFLDPNDGVPHPVRANPARLTQLLGHVETELRAILTELGYPVEAK